MNNKYYAGIDIGAAFSKAVILLNRDIIGWSVIPSGNSYRLAAEKVFTEALNKTGLKNSDIRMIIATGCGANNVSLANETTGEFVCNGRAVHFLAPEVSTVIDIGGQFSRVFHVDRKGKMVGFILSEKCAAGSGRLLQVLARVLQVKLEELGELSLKSTRQVNFTTSCAVFIESEIISRIAEGYSKEDIIAGVHRSLAAKVQTLVERLGFLPEVAFIGGSASNIGLAKALEEALSHPLVIPDIPQITTALGAALIAGDKDTSIEII